MGRPLNIQIIFRTPVGGLFRHVRDLVRGISNEGHRAGVICDSLTGGDQATAMLAGIEKHCALGITRLPVSRLPGFGDITAAREIARIAATSQPDILHGHGAKGGLYARLAGRILKVPSVYTPHGGSLHFKWSSPAGAVFLGTEKLLRPLGSGLHFVCNFERDEFQRKIGLGKTPYKVVHNGLWPEEFSAVPPQPNATDVVFVGELRQLKGVDVLIRALALARKARPVSATIVGGGSERESFERLTQELDLASLVTFTGALPARTAFGRGRIFVMPSRAESFPYVILEAVAANLPVIASDIGGIPEILPRRYLIPPDDPGRLSQAILDQLATPRDTGLSTSTKANFDCTRMVRDILAFYGELIHSGKTY